MRELFLIITLFAVLLLLLLPMVGHHTDGENTESSAEEETSGLQTTIAESTPTTYPEEASDFLSDTDILVEVDCRDGVKSLTLDSYLCGILMAELPLSFADEAWKALAVAARSYVLYRMECGLPLSDDSTVCTAYLSDAEARNRFGDRYHDIFQKARQAVTETAHEVLLYDGEICCTVFHAMSYEKTEDASAVWGGEIPYLISVTTPEPRGLEGIYTSVTMDKDTFLSALSLSDLSLFRIRRTDSGRIMNMTFCADGKMIGFSGMDLRRIFSLRSTDFVFRETENDFVVFEVYGYGHGVGMSQWGAHIMAEEGWDYRQILYHYYPNTVCAVM
ncbi:MAG: SpoIID/LytB domain-containing protein [Clostridia bacterium]|nr:SpoIID/LytB domain-containing protein [Clostridia bacterium]